MIHYDAADIPLRHKTFRPADSKSSEWSNAYERLRAIISKAPIIAILGNRGNGKTQMAACLIGFATLELGRTARYLKSLDVFLSIRQEMRPEGRGELVAIQKLIEPFLLVIDAFEVRSDSEFENRMLDDVVDKRYDSLKATIIISNDTVENFTKRVGPSICDRIVETGGIVELKGQSFRGRL